MTGTEIYPVRVFTREDECTKVDITNCFWEATKFVPVPVVQARGYIGLNTPKYLLREDLVVQTYVDQIDYYTLTPKGVDWLLKGLKRHLQLHPEHAIKLVSNPLDMVAARVAAKAKDPGPQAYRARKPPRASRR